jgi:hypothetical protein
MRFMRLPWHLALACALCGAARAQSTTASRPTRLPLAELAAACTTLPLPVPPTPADWGVWNDGGAFINGVEVHNQYLTFVLEKRKDVGIALMGTSRIAIDAGTFKPVPKAHDIHNTRRPTPTIPMIHAPNYL